MNNLLFFVFSLLSIAVLSQENCSCSTELDFVIDYYERNLPGFKDNVTSKTKAYYDNLKQNLRRASKKADNKLACFKVLTYYVEFFKDNHSSIRMYFPPIDEKDPNQLDIFYKSKIYNSREFYALHKDELKQYPIDDIRGIYQTKDSAYTIAVIQNKNTLRDYIGVIVESKSKLWNPGHVKLEIKKDCLNSHKRM